MHGRFEVDIAPGLASSSDCHVAGCHAATGVGPLVDSELEALEARIDARLRRLVIADRLRSIGVPAAVTGALALGLVLV